MRRDDHEAALATLRAQLRRYDPGRYPVQHATAQFHLGVTLLQAGRPAEALEALQSAAEGFRPLAVEHAKALNMLGAALRDLGRPEEAAEAFAAARTTFGEQDLPSEEAAASYNLGLTHAAAGRHGPAIDCFSQARRRFEEARLPAQAAQAARELGAAQLAAGDAGAAVEVLDAAVEQAEQAGDRPGLGAAANALGLAHLHRGDHARAVAALRSAAGAHPRRVRPDAYAMAKANLALAYEAAGAPLRARLAARQALGAGAAAAEVRVQADAVLERVGRDAGGLADILDDEDPERWPALVREEVERWADAPAEERLPELGAWVDAVLDRSGRGPELVTVWLGALLELPPADMETGIADALAVLADRGAEARERFGAFISRAFARFHGPQWMRLKDTFDRLAAERGEEPTWR